MKTINRAFLRVFLTETAKCHFIVPFSNFRIYRSTGIALHRAGAHSSEVQGVQRTSCNITDTRVNYI